MKTAWIGIATVVIGFGLATPALAKKAPKASLVQNVGAQPSGSPCTTSTIPMDTETVVAASSAAFPQGPWTYVVQGVAIFNNPQTCCAIKASFRGYIGTGDPNVDLPVNLGDTTFNGGEQKLVPFLLILKNIAAKDTKSFSVTAVFSNLFNQTTPVIQGQCVSVGFLATEHN